MHAQRSRLIVLKHWHVLFLLPINKPASEKSDQQLVEKKIEVSQGVSETFPWKAGNCWADIIKFSNIISWCLGGDCSLLRVTHRLTSKFCLLINWEETIFWGWACIVITLQEEFFKEILAGCYTFFIRTLNLNKTWSWFFWL